MLNWAQVLNPSFTARTSSLFQSSLLSVKMQFEPLPDEVMPHRDVVQKIKNDHDFVRGQWSKARLVVMKEAQASPMLYLGGVYADGPLVTADLSSVTLRNVLADGLTNQFCFVFIGSAEVDDANVAGHNAGHTAEFQISFHTEDAFWAFALLMKESHSQEYHFFQFPGIRYRDKAVDLASLNEDPIMPLQEWTGAQVLFCGVIFGLLPSFLKLILLLFMLFLPAV